MAAKSMPNLKGLLSADGPARPTRTINYYRDLFLFWPFLLFTVSALVDFAPSSQDHRVAIRFAALSIISILLARERLLLVCSALGFCAVRGLITLSLTGDRRALGVAVLFGAVFFLLVRLLKGYKPSYEWPRGLSVFDLLVGLSSLGVTMLIARYVRG